ncbi:hypothetical protein HDU77_006035 [Chytriomyces hyalinus]|nr:hypothetical protein HDU77_006035 [Chytriomyces hyalinus]
MSAILISLIVATIATNAASALPVANGPSPPTASQTTSQQYPNLAPFLAPLFLLVAVAGVVATVGTVRRRRMNQPAFVPPVLAYHVMMDPCDGQVLVFGDTVQDLYNQVAQPRGDAPAAAEKQ